MRIVSLLFSFLVFVDAFRRHRHSFPFDERSGIFFPCFLWFCVLQASPLTPRPAQVFRFLPKVRSYPPYSAIAFINASRASL